MKIIIEICWLICVHVHFQGLVSPTTPINLPPCDHVSIQILTFLSWLFFREGAGDCSSCVSVMLELARGVSQWAHGFKSAVMFLFNTGEEEGLNGAYSFMTQVCSYLDSLL